MVCVLDIFHVIQASRGINSHLFPACNYLPLSQCSFLTKLLLCWLFLSNTEFSNLSSSVLENSEQSHVENSFSFIFEAPQSDIHEWFWSKTGRKVLIQLLQFVVQHKPYQHPICLRALGVFLAFWPFFCAWSVVISLYWQRKAYETASFPCIEIQKH